MAYYSFCCWAALSSTTTTTRAMSTGQSPLQHQQPKVAVIGAGAAGLATARILSRSSVTPVVFEQRPDVGGVWKYDNNNGPDDDDDNDAKKKDKPMYRGLRTNLPKEIMAFREYPFPSALPSFVTHRNVQEYLQSYRDHYELQKYISYNTRVDQLTVLKEETSCFSVSSDPNETSPKIKLQWSTRNDGAAVTHEEDVFDGVFICNGHYATPAIPDLPGLDLFEGKTMHSIEYDDPADFSNQRVLCIGGRASGSDLAREISQHAKHVYLSDTTCEKEETKDNVTWVPKTIKVLPDNRIAFESCGVSPQVDVIVFCSGYDYSFPFINPEKSNLDLCVGDRRVMPLYRQLWHARHPNLAFIGIPHSVVPFPLFEFQVEAVWNVWNHQQNIERTLPPINVRMDEAESDRTKASRPQDTHFLGSQQWDYCKELAKLAGNCTPTIEQYIDTNKAIYDHAGAARKSLFPGGPDTYREINYKRLDESCTFQVLSESAESICE